MDQSIPRADTTKSNGNAFWEVLNDSVHPCLDTLPGRLGFSGDCHNRPTRVLACLLLVLIPICFLAFSRPRRDYDIHTRAALRALLAIVTPTCSLWPSRYVKLASIRRSHVDIPLEMIIEDTIDGIIEFRDPVNDLVDLISSGANVHGHTICITIAWKWWIDCFEWWALAKSKSDYPTLHPGGCILGLSDCRWLNDNTPTVNSSPLGLPLSPFALTSLSPYPLFCLDYLPHPMIPTLNAGCKVILQFTAFSPSLRTLSTAQILSAIPFINSGHPPRRPRTLVSVLKQLSASYGSNLVVDSVSNVSADYVHTLGRLYASFSREQKIREMWVNRLGTKAWRRDMFLVALEAALLHRGWIERWAIQVTTK